MAEFPASILITESQMHEALRTWIRENFDSTWCWGDFEIAGVVQEDDAHGKLGNYCRVDLKEPSA